MPLAQRAPDNYICHYCNTNFFLYSNCKTPLQHKFPAVCTQFKKNCIGSFAANVKTCEKFNFTVLARPAEISLQRNQT